MDSAECVLIRSRRAVLLHTPYSPPGLDSYTASVIGWDYHVCMYGVCTVIVQIICGARETDRVHY